MGPEVNQNQTQPWVGKAAPVESSGSHLRARPPMMPDTAGGTSQFESYRKGQGGVRQPEREQAQEHGNCAGGAGETGGQRNRRRQSKLPRQGQRDRDRRWTGRSVRGRSMQELAPQQLDLQHRAGRHTRMDLPTSGAGAEGKKQPAKIESRRPALSGDVTRTKGRPSPEVTRASGREAGPGSLASPMICIPGPPVAGRGRAKGTR